ncbi:MAG: zinc ribbon domain-containing protein [Agathobacter sp.]|nr:zinc ribbon domain-containing protein [Agathobacter sp.]
MNENVKKLSIKNVLRALCALCTVFVFCPSFLVSCSGQYVKVGVMTAVGGVYAYGERIVAPHPLMLICLLIPIAGLVLLIVKKYNDKKTSVIIMIGSVIDTIIWIAFRVTVKEIAEQNYCEFSTTVWYVFNIISLLLIIFLSALIVFKKLQMDSDLLCIIRKNLGKALNDIQNEAINQNKIGICQKCGASIVQGCKFCSSCGSLVPDRMLNKEDKVINNNKFCHECGAEIKSDSVFCVYCGKKND